MFIEKSIQKLENDSNNYLCIFPERIELCYRKENISIFGGNQFDGMNRNSINDVLWRIEICTTFYCLSQSFR